MLIAPVNMKESYNKLKNKLEGVGYSQGKTLSYHNLIGYFVFYCR